MKIALILSLDIHGGLDAFAAFLHKPPERANDLGCSVLRARLAPQDQLREAADRIRSSGIPFVFVSGGYCAMQDTVPTS